ncbi:unnamed protein product [Auanema sp. JU1783]|nr:unnamed protein product [Auanema sp. JU1783]
MTTWADIQRLAADLQRVQLSQSAKKLSDANCIEVVTKLIERQLIDVVFTRDGRSYVTKKHLSTEVKNECLANRGRASLTDIAKALNVDFDHIDRAVKEIIQTDVDYVFSKGELFAKEYVDNLLSDLRVILEENGSETLDNLCKLWDISIDLLNSLVLNNLPAEFNGFVDGPTIYTKEYLEEHKNILRAVIVSVTKPTAISAIQNRVHLSSKRFWAAYDELVEAGEIVGRLSGSRTSPSCTYIPPLHDKLVECYLQSSYRQDEYIQKSLLRKVGVADTSASISLFTTDKKVESLPTLFLSCSLYDQCVQTLKEAVEINKVCDVQNVVQNIGIPLEIDDVDELSQKLSKGDKNISAADGYLYSVNLLRDVLTQMEELIEKRAHSEIGKMENEKKNSAKQTASVGRKVDDDDDWGDSKGKGKKKGGKTGGGAKGGKGKSPDNEDRGSGGVLSIPSETITEWITQTNDLPETLVESVAEQLNEQIHDKLRNRVKELLLTQQTADAQSQKRNILAVQAKAKSLYDSLCAFESASTSYPDPLGSDLTAHIVRTVGSELAAAVLTYASGTENAGSLSEKQRDETIKNLPSGSQEALNALYESLKGDYQNIHDAIEKVSSRAGCSLLLKPADHKTIAIWTQGYIQELKESLSTQTDPASVLLTVVLLLLAKAGRPTTASGKFVARLVAELSDIVPQKTHELLTSCQKGVVNCIKNKDDEVAKELLLHEIGQLKTVVLD